MKNLRDGVFSCLAGNSGETDGLETLLVDQDEIRRLLDDALHWHNEQAYVKAFFAFLDGKLAGPPVVDYLEEV